jgi:hypothetical protein
VHTPEGPEPPGIGTTSDTKGTVMASIAKKSIVTLFAGAAMVTAAAAPASAAPNQFQDGLVNVAVGNVTILEDVNIGVAAQVAAAVCGVKVGPVAVLGSAVDRGLGDRTVCTNDNEPIRLVQNT